MLRFKNVVSVIAMLLTIGTSSLFADDVYARIKGTITDTSGAVVPDAQVTASNTQTGVDKTITGQSNGDFEFAQLPVGTYTISASKPGFKTFKSTPIVVTVNENYRLPIKLEVGSASETVEVTANSVQVETTSIQQQTLVNSQQIVELPLNGRNFTNLEQLAPGVQSSNDRFGTFSVNGSQSQQSNYLINGLDTNDIPLNTPQVLPSPDAIQEFNLVSSTINPEYGRNSGGIVNAIIKSGTNQFHGTAFDFYRDSFLNSRGFFSPLHSTPLFHQNQFGGTLGGPIWKDKTFFFLSYQGTYNASAGLTGAPTSTPVFSQSQRNGLFPDLATSAGTSATPLVGSNGVTFPAGTPYSMIFANGQIPAADLNPLSVKLLNQFVPLPNAPNNAFDFNNVSTLKGNQGIARIDHNFTQSDLVWGLYIIQDAPSTALLPFAGGTLPGFAEQDQRRTNDVTAAWSHTFNSSSLNEFRLGYARFNFNAVNPVNPALPSAFGFSNINPQNARAASAPLITVGGFFDLGFSADGPQPRKDQTYQLTDNFSKIAGRHALKFGFDGRRFQVDNPFFFQNNGVFTFNGAGVFSTGDPGADFLLGIPDSYAQSGGGVINARAYEYYAYFQDQWKVSRNLTLTLGSGYQIDTPYHNNQFGGKDFNCFIPGEQSTVFPTAPLGLVYPGDPGCNNAGTTTRYDHVAPRAGFAWSPGSANQFSIRGGFGVYFNRTEEEGALQNLTEPPFSVSSTGAVANGATQVGFANPFQNAQTGVVGTTPFPLTSFPSPGQPFDFAALGPQVLNTISPLSTTPYAMNFNLTVQREFPGNTVASLGYVGSLGRHLVRSYEDNLITLAGQAACKTNPTCVANADLQSVFFPSHLIAGASFPAPGTPNGVEAFLPSVGVQATDGTSNYNAFQANITKGASHGLQLIASYTWSHAIDNGSGLEDSGFGNRGINPYIPALNVGNSAFDARQRFVIGYLYQVPSLHSMANWASNAIFGGWNINGITTFRSGFPINISTATSSSLFCSQAATKFACPDNPDQIAPVTFVNPKTSSIHGRGGYFFNPAAFAEVPPCTFTNGILTNGNVCGQFGNVGRNTIVGPGSTNFDMALIKHTKITEHANLELGLEAFNVFNHTNFLFGRPGSTQAATPNAVVTNANIFGRITNAEPGRIVQLRAKINF
jgi:hypothetical protein